MQKTSEKSDWEWTVRLYLVGLSDNMPTPMLNSSFSQDAGGWWALALRSLLYARQPQLAWQVQRKLSTNAICPRDTRHQIHTGRS